MIDNLKPILLPEPRRIDFTGGVVNIGNAPPFNSSPAEQGGSIRSESYKLIVKHPDKQSPHPVIIEAVSESGVCHGLRTLKQLKRQFGTALPCMLIEDEPSFPVRGVMLDISRDRIPKQDELLRFVDLLGSWKINHLQLYTEHTFAYKGHEVVWKDTSPLTADEIKELDERCLEQGITLAANQNCFGHMERWLKHSQYQHLAETTGEWKFLNTKRSGGFSLCPTDERSIALIADLLGQLLPNFSSGLVNIGCDETFDVGQGRSREAVEKQGYAKVYADFVRQVINIASKHKFRSMFWADMALKSPEALAMLPKDAIVLIWGYEPDSPFDSWCSKLKDADFEYWVCPGTSSWRSITGRTFERKTNLANAVKVGVKYGASGFLITDWGDLGHRQQSPIALHALAEAANAAWNADSVDRFDSQASSLFAFNDVSLEIANWLDVLGNVDLGLRKKTGIKNASCIFNDLQTPLYKKGYIDNPDDWIRVKEMLSEGREYLPKKLYRQLTDELSHTLDVAMFAIDRSIYRLSDDKLGRKKQLILIKQLKQIIEEHRKLWLIHSRQGGLEDSCKYYEDILYELEQQ
ncbi:family 20 glycosylhydrolase [bacterium]|nr:family 20 glycosylhydrolase [bacterium]